MMDVHYEKDKRLIPYLIASNPQVSLVDTRNDNGVVFFGFSPAPIALELISDFFTDQCPAMSPKRLFDAIEEFKTILYREKEKYRMMDGGNGYGNNYR